MPTAPVVVAFSDSQALRETLSVLLEDDCHLRFLGIDRVPPTEAVPADVALVATRHAAGLLHELTRRWPTLPIVSVQMAETAPRLPLSYRHIESVPLEPHAIRAAVFHKLSDTADAALRARLEPIIESLRDEVAYALGVLRACAAPRAVGAAPDTHVMALMMREQSRLLTEAIDHLHRFCTRPTGPPLEPAFAEALCQELQRPDAELHERALRYECTGDVNTLRHPGPIALVVLLATLLRAHLRRRCDAPTVRIALRHDALELCYPPRPRPRTSPEATSTWPLLLARLALERSGWRLSNTDGDGTEAIRLSPDN